MQDRSLRGVLAAALAAAASILAVTAAPAGAVAPGNDTPQGAFAFARYTAANGSPRAQQAIAELVEATPDPSLPRCLGGTSFARTVWYRIPETAGPQEITVEAMGRTLDVVDLAAYVQPEIPVTPPPPPPPPPEPPPEPDSTPSGSGTAAPRATTAQAFSALPNACFGTGSGGADAAEEPTSGLTLRVPPRHPVLLQVGRRGPVMSAADEQVVLSLDVQLPTNIPRPAGDRANLLAPQAPTNRTITFGLAGATITEEDPAEPICPSAGTIWRRLMPGQSGRRLITVKGSGAHTFTVFAGARPTALNALECVVREGVGPMQMRVPVHKGQPLWIRIGTDAAPEGDQATIAVRDGTRATVIDGGPGGFDPTTGGPGGGLPSRCLQARPDLARVDGPALRGSARARNRSLRVPLLLRVRRATICDVELRLFGPGGLLYAQGRLRSLHGTSVVRLGRVRGLRRGRYRLTVRVVDGRRPRIKVPSTVRGRLR